jgi:DNA polymerase
LLLSWSIDGGEVETIDFTAEGLGPAYKLIKYLENPEYLKTAYNVAFEHEVFRRIFGIDFPIEQWQDTMILAAYAGLPRRLAEVGKALGLPEDKQKMKEGAALIRYFCIPFKGKRRMPSDSPERWQTFVEYNRQDVVTEMTIRNLLLEGFPLPKREQKLWVMDQKINDFGVGIDLPFVEAAIDLANKEKDRLTAEAIQISGLENPNSVSQLKQWLGLDEGATLRKADVADMLQTVTDETKKRVLQIRQQLGKSSVSKFDAMARSACPDGRVRGSLAFYGANRTGRFAGRLIQVQNYPQNHIGDGSFEDLAFARKLVEQRDAEGLRFFFGDDINALLSQLTRTALRPRPGYAFAVADFSAIEARVLAWLAGEEWVLKAFLAGKDIYCETASQMFHVPVVKNGINGDLRQKGKQAVLSCIAEGELVLTNRGLKPIETVSIDDYVWDGSEWVKHEGVVYRGQREVITYDGLTATPDHVVWAWDNGTPRPIQFGLAAASGAHLIHPCSGWDSVRLGNCHQPGKTLEQDLESLLCTDEVQRMRDDTVAESGEPTLREVQGLSKMLTAPKSTEVAVQAANRCQEPLREPNGPGISELRSTGDLVRLRERSGGLPVSDRDLRCAEQVNGDRQDRQQQGLRTGEHPLRDQAGAVGKPTDNGTEQIRTEVLALRRDSGQEEAVRGSDTRGDHRTGQERSSMQAEELERHPRKVAVYDIRNAGRHHRFTVSNCLVHNCGYGGSTGALINMGALRSGMTEEELPELVEKWRQANPHIVHYWYKMGDAAMNAVKYGESSSVGTVRLASEIRSGIPVMTMSLPSGRSLFYIRPGVGTNRFGGESLTYEGYETGKWSRVETFSGKLVENVTQAVARDCLCRAMYKVMQKYPVTFHVHDEMIVEVPEDQADKALEDMLDIMAEPIPWAPGLVLKGAGYTCPYYYKD